MDNQDNTIIGFVSILLSVATVIMGAINHKRLRSSCCKKEIEVSFDVENTTPPPKAQAQSA